MFAGYKSSKSDEYYTPEWVWQAIAPFLPKDKVVWEAFGVDPLIPSTNYLKKLGFQVVQTQKDFFLENKGDIIVSNPPFSQMKKVLERMVELDKPFCLLANQCCLHSNYFKRIFKDSLDELQMFIPPKINYLCKIDDEIKPGVGCPYYSVVLCWKMKLEKDIIFISK